jgi:hypothetical protein
MDRLESSLGLEVLRFRVAPPLGKTMKGEGYQTQEILKTLLAYFFHCVLFFVILFCICFSPCIVVVYYGLSPCITLTCCGPLPCVVLIRYGLLSLIALTCCGP